MLNMHNNFILSMWVICIVVTDLVVLSVNGYKIHVVVEDDDKNVKDWVYSDEDTTNNVHTANSTKASNSLNQTANGTHHSISKRGVTFPGDCVSVLSEEGHSPETRALIVDLEGEMELPCHYCFETAAVASRSMIWYKFVKVASEVTGHVMWQAREVILDMHDDPNLNTVYVDIQHTLFIKQFQPNHVGSYFCSEYTPGANGYMVAFSSPAIESDSALALGVALRQVNKIGGLHFLYHVDIGLPVRSVTVSEMTGSDLPQPSPRSTDPVKNVAIDTKWQPWGECSVCGPAGERRRVGHCVVTLLDTGRLADPPHVDHILRAYPAGAPCHSSLFSGMGDSLRTRPDEIEIGQCDKPCTDEPNKDFMEKILLESDLKKKQIASEKPVKAVRVNAKEGQSVPLPCTGALPTNVVTWYNRTKPVSLTRPKDGSLGRVYIDSKDQLVIQKLTAHDSSKYFCYQSGKKLIEVVLEVKEQFVREDVRQPLIYLGYTFAADFGIFIVIMILKHCKHCCGKVKQNYFWVNPTVKKFKTSTKGFKDKLTLPKLNLNFADKFKSETPKLNQKFRNFKDKISKKKDARSSAGRNAATSSAKNKNTNNPGIYRTNYQRFIPDNQETYYNSHLLGQEHNRNTNRYENDNSDVEYYVYRSRDFQRKESIAWRKVDESTGNHIHENNYPNQNNSNIIGKTGAQTFQNLEHKNYAPNQQNLSNRNGLHNANDIGEKSELCKNNFSDRRYDSFYQRPHSSYLIGESSQEGSSISEKSIHCRDPEYVYDEDEESPLTRLQSSLFSISEETEVDQALDRELLFHACLDSSGSSNLGDESNDDSDWSLF